MAEFSTKRVRCLMSEVMKQCDLEDVVKHNMYRKENNLHRKPFLAFYTTINGYHKFRVKPMERRMVCVREPDNEYDQNAIKIFIANTNIPVGRMPKTCAQIVAEYMDEGHIIGTTVYWKIDQWQHGPSVDLGDGPKLVCFFAFDFSNFDKRSEMANQFLQRMIAFDEANVP